MDIGALNNIDCSNYTIMIVDDIPINTRLLGKLLEPAGFREVLQFNDSQTALDSVKDIKPHIIILDVMMPGIDGFSFLSAIRENRSFDDIRIIMVTAVSESEEVQKASNMGANDYLTKPINAKRLYSSIANQLSLLQEGGDR